MVSERWERGREGRSRCTWVSGVTINVIGEKVLHPKVVGPFVIVKVWY